MNTCSSDTCEISKTSETSKTPQNLPRSKHRWLKRILIFCILLFLLSSAGIFYIHHRLEQAWLPADSTSTELIPVTVQPGSGVASIAELLQEKNLIQDASAFMLYCRIHQLTQLLQAGNYEFSSSQSSPEIAWMIAEGKIALHMLTIPEGFTVEQIGQALSEAGYTSETAWQKALAQDYGRNYISRDKKIREPLEGFLFPDTYDLTENLSAPEITEIMLGRFDDIWEEKSVSISAPAVKKLSKHEIVTIASLIERECQVKSEQQRISGVIYNRLNRDMKLQIDATVLYALGRHKETVLLSDLEYDSPYNTYVYKGLPPGPIACPGADALYAAMHPEEHEFLYYVAVGNGSHEFSTNFEDHLKAQRKYQQ